MSNTNYTPKSSYVGTGSLDTYTFDFLITNLTQLLVVVVDDTGEEVQRVRGDDVTFLSTVSFDSINGGGTVVLADDLDAGYKIALVLDNEEPTQDSEFANKNSFSLKRFEQALDKLSIQIQTLAFKAKRAFKIHETDDETTFTPQLPPGVADMGDHLVAISDDGTELKYGPTVTEVEGWKADAEQAAIDAQQAATDAINAATSGVASAAAAAASATAAAASETNSDISETNAAASEAAALAAQTAAEAAQAAAENAANSSIWAHVVFLTFANSPRTITNADKGTLFVVDTTGGNFVFNLAQISTLTLTSPWSVGIKKSDVSGNIVTVNRGGTDTFDDASTSKTISVPSAGLTLVPDNTPNPDVWTAVLFGAGGGSAAPSLSGTRAAPTPISAPGGIAFGGSSYYNKFFLVSNGGSIVVGSSPQIQAGTLVGQKLLLEFCSDTDTIELNDGNGLDLQGKFISENKRKLEIEWDGSVWCENWRR